MYKYSEFILEYKNRKDKSDFIEDFSDLYIERIAKKLNVKLVKKLGKGSFGIAYLADKDKVIKVTTDAQEAENAIRLSDIELEYFLNYYDVFEMTLDKIEYSKGKKVYFILMDYVRPLQGKEREYWGRYYEGFFGNYTDEEFLDDVWEDYTWGSTKDGKLPTKIREEADKAIEYFKPFLKRQRWKMKDEASDYGIEFSDAHANNLGIRKSDGAIIYFDIGYYDSVTVEGEHGEVEYEIDKVDFENDFKKVKKMIINNYKPYTVIPINKVIGDISKLLNVNKVKAYKYLRDEVFLHYEKSTANGYPPPLMFIAKDKGTDWYYEDGIIRTRMDLKSAQIEPHWKEGKMDIGLTFKDDYKDRTLEKEYKLKN
ncbi:MAG: hypothetical protein SLAVMIC_00996 [uncultured marine phage]|uniref:Uncharacterized protein n=1 Tax=uncultured marine phage TaxID=707152 RepID=A0A8D9CDZ1_9VIRU|nr:MAG: hypothetical protein SLAVMIC_00996 [uncultured marine phage]